jgi:methyl-accepting chemotaxis protein
VDGVAGALEEMAQRIGKVEIPTDLITAKIAPLADAVALALAKVEQAAQGAADSNDRLSQALSRIQGNVVRINEAMLKLADFTDHLGALVLLLKEMREEIARLAGGLKDASATIIVVASNTASTQHTSGTAVPQGEAVQCADRDEGNWARTPLSSWSEGFFRTCSRRARPFGVIW